MPPEERRAAIIDAARPLLIASGTDFTTRQVAEAAGVAEGTIFRVFTSMAELQEAVINDIMDAKQTHDALAQINLASPLPERVRAIIAVVQEHVRQTHVLFSLAAHAHYSPDAKACRRSRFEEVEHAITERIVALLTPDANHLATTPEVAAVMLRASALASSHPLLGREDPNDPTQLADFFLNGVLRSNT